MRSSGGGGGSGGAAFTAKRRAYGPGAQSWRWGRGWCSPQSAGFLVVIAGVWVTVLLLFGTALFMDNTHKQQHAHAAVGGSSFHRHVEASELGALQAEVKGLSQRVDALAAHQARPALDLPDADASEPRTEKGLFDAQPKKQAQQGGKDSRTSPLPLVDPTVLTRTRPAFGHGDMEGLCRHRSDGDEEILDRVTVWDKAEMGKPRIMCISFTLQKYHDSAVQNVRRTWGQKCDGYVAMSDFTDPDIPSVDIKHDGPEAYENMWQVRLGCWGCECIRIIQTDRDRLDTVTIDRRTPTHFCIHTHHRKSEPSGCTSTSTTSTTSTISSRGCVFCAFGSCVCV